jgi:hypothetical protein
MRRFPLIECALIFGVGITLVLRPLTRQLSGSTAVVVATTAPVTYADELDQILKRAVKGQRVDYDLIRRKFAGPLTACLDEMSSRQLETLSKDDRLAFYINLYNATMIRAVLEHRHDGFTPSEDDFAVFKAPLVHLPGGRTVSLNTLETDIIRKEFKDPRVHVALNCAARSCPPLLDRAYRGQDLDRVLDQNMKRFVLDTSRNQIDDQKKELRLSKIFDWYAADFGGKDHIVAYVSQYAGRDLSGYTVSFLDYDWSLNAARNHSSSSN